MRSCICAGIHFFYSSCFRKTIISSHKYKLMKQLKYLIYLLTLVFALYSCSSGDDSNNGDGSGTTAEEVNTNRNIVTTDAAVARLEFQHCARKQNDRRQAVRPRRGELLRGMGL